MISERLQIGCDLDDVLFPVAQSILDFYQENYYVEVPLSSYYSNDPAVWGVLDFDVAVERVNEFLQSKEFFDLEPTQETIDTLSRLAVPYDWHAITGRSDCTLAHTSRQLERHFPNVFKSKICTDYNAGSVTKGGKTDKGMVCAELGVDVMIDDLDRHALVIARRGISVILFGDNPYNKIDDLPDNVIPAPGGWSQVEEILESWTK